MMSRAGGIATVGKFWVRWPVPTRRARRLLAALVAGCALLAATPGRSDFGNLHAISLIRYGPEAADSVLRWRDLVEMSQDLPVLEQLRNVNDFFNLNVQFADDREVWGVADYWATPVETLGRGRGDCEDYSIAKYVTLGLLGVPLEHLRITYVRAETDFAGPRTVQAHMVLAYYPTPNADPWILDNLVGEVLPASRRRDLQPVFGFNSESLWVAGVRASNDPTSRLSPWRDLLRRLGGDGLH
jgi:predicted transglutaminase-like cysteine proteinase